MTVFRDIEISLTQQCMFFLVSVLLGAAIGVFYDAFRIIRIAFRHNAVTVFFEDLLFCAVTCIALILMIFCANYGIVRWFSLFGCAGGFSVYRETVGRAVVGAAQLIIGFVKKYIIAPIRRVAAFIVFSIIRFIRYLASRILIFWDFVGRKAYCAVLLHRASKGFGL